MSSVSTARLAILRATYLFIAAGLAITRWPGIVNPPADASHMDGVVASMLGAFSLLMLLGIRYPLRMLPLLGFELLWKSMWVLLWAVPRLLDHQMDAARQETLVACLMGIVLVPIAMPWGHVVDRYIRARGEPWSMSRPESPPQATTIIPS
jgi:hypothetical protein